MEEGGGILRSFGFLVYLIFVYSDPPELLPGEGGSHALSRCLL